MDLSRDTDGQSVQSSSTTNSYNEKPRRDTKRKKTPTSRPFNLPSAHPNTAIAMLVEESLLSSEFREAIKKEFYDVLVGTIDESVPSSSGDPNAAQGAYYAGSGNHNVENTKKYTFLPLTTPLAGLVHWIKCDHCRQLQSVVDNANRDAFAAYGKFVPYLEHLTLFIVPTDEFCEKAMPIERELQSEWVSCEFERLDEWVARIHDKLQRQQPPRDSVRNPYDPRIVMAFVDLEKACLKLQRKLNKTGKAMAVQERIDQALVHLTLVHDIEIFQCKNVAKLCEHLNTLTKVLETNVEKAHVNAYDCIMKASKQKAPDGLSREQLASFELQQTWAAMLQMVPLLSKEKAVAFVQNPEYSCVKRVYEAMNDAREPEKKRQALLQNNFGATKGGIVRNEAKLAKHIYRLMTVTDPEATLQEE